MRNKKIIDRNYGSIPHLSISKLTQQADKKISIGQEEILTKKSRDYKDLIVVTEKLDGSNVGVICQNGFIKAVTRSGYEAITSEFEQHRLFQKWVYNNMDLFEFLREGERICGEWMAMSHGIKYDITDKSPFVAFDIFDYKNKRLKYLDFIKICAVCEIRTAPLVHIGQPISIKNSMNIVGGGLYAPCEYSEGVVYRCERDNKVDFLAKYVVPQKEDGKYMKDEIYNKGFIS